MKKFISPVWMMAASFALVCVIVSGCATTQGVTLAKPNPTTQVATVAQVPDAGNSPEMNAFLETALQNEGILLKAPLPLGTRKSEEVDAIISYVDVWYWDLVMYLKALNVRIYEAETGDLLVTGQWDDSALHGFRDAEVIMQSVISEMLTTLRGANPNMSEPAKSKPTQEGDDAKPAVKTVREGSDQLADGRYVLILSNAIGNSNCVAPFPDGKQQAFSVENSAVKQEPSPFIRVRSRDIRIYGEEFSATFVGPYILQGRPAMRFKGRRIDNGFQGTYIAPVASDACMGDFQLLRVAQ